MIDITPKAESLKERAYGHPEIWEITLDEFVAKVWPVVQDHMLKNKLSKKVVELGIQFLRIKFDKRELKGTIGYEVATAIEEAMMYYVNCLGEEI